MQNHTRRVKYFSLLSIEKDITKSLPYKLVIKEHAAKICMEKSRGLSGNRLIKNTYIGLDL